MVSIVIPVYNVENYLEKCLISVLNQTFKNIEVIIINDGSTDNSLKICKKFEKEDSRIVLINQENKGLSEARNRGIEKAINPYITFIDSDDWVENCYIETLYNSLLSNNADIAVAELNIVYQKSKKKSKKKSKTKQGKNDGKISVYNNFEALSELFIDNSIKNYACGKMYKTKLFKDIRYPKGVYFEDVFTTYKLFYESKKIVKIDKILMHYVQRINSITSQNYKNIKKEIDLFNGFTGQLKFIMENKYKLNNFLSIKRNMARKLYRIKKRIINNYQKSEILTLKEIDNKINFILKENKLDIVLLKYYFKSKIIIKK
ncbi:MAG: glycosyltransferase family 2 protein [Tenacibaculum sp.]